MGSVDKFYCGVSLVALLLGCQGEAARSSLLGAAAPDASEPESVPVDGPMGALGPGPSGRAPNLPVVDAGGSSARRSAEPPTFDGSEPGDAGPGQPGDRGPVDVDGGHRAESDLDAGVGMDSGDGHNAPAPLKPPSVSAPELLGVLVGPQAARPLGDVAVYGTDLGFPVVHDDRLMLLFGDTSERASDVCAEPRNDDSLGYLPPALDGGVPELTIVAQPDDPGRFRPIRLLAEGRALSMALGRAPIGGFVDSGRVYAWFNRQVLLPCASDQSTPRCSVGEGFDCTTGVGTCEPARATVVPPLCDATDRSGCPPLQTCELGDAAFCFDPTSSPADGSASGQIGAAVHVLELGLQDLDDPTTFERVATFATSKFYNLAARAVAHWSKTNQGNDYRLGDDAVLMWGRPGFIGDEDGDAQLYLMAQRLPLTAAGDGQLQLSPDYFAGTDPDTGQPRWSPHQKDAAPIALDGMPGGDPTESRAVVNMMSLSWLGPPVNLWMMAYGGGVSEYLVASERDPNADADSGSLEGAIVARFAEHPWGPFSPAQVMFAPGAPSQAGPGYGPGGVLYHPACSDSGGAVCAPADGDFGPGLCLGSLALWDQGRLYAPMILEPYTSSTASGGFDIVWLVSTWNPYHIAMLRTSITL